MRRLITRLPVLALLAAAGCTSHPAAPPGAADTEAARQRDAAKTEAMERIQALQEAVDEARARVAAAEPKATSLSRTDRLVLSETRRAIVVANVSLQKARTAVADGDYSAARAATDGAVERLAAASRLKAADSRADSARSPR
jgi:hypothetical protein